MMNERESLSNTTTRPHATTVALALLAALASDPIAAAPFTVQVFGPSQGYSFASSVNDAGLVAGTVNQDSGSDAFLWDSRTNTFASLGPRPIGFDFRGANAVNNAGQMVGALYAPPQTQFAYSWQGGATTLIPLLPNALSGVATGVSDTGYIVGYNQMPGFPGNSSPFISDGLTTSALPLMAGMNSGSVFAVNNAGHAVGYQESQSGSGFTSAVLWKDGLATDLGFAKSTALDINDAGVIALIRLEGPSRTFFTWRDGIATDLFSALGGSITSMNEAGQLVGNYSNGGAPEAFLWDPAFGLINLDEQIDDLIGWSDITAQSINELGQIAGYGLNPFGGIQSFLLTRTGEAFNLPPPSQVPEPATLALVSIALLGIARRVRGATKKPQS